MLAWAQQSSTRLLDLDSTDEHDRAAHGDRGSAPAPSWPRPPRRSRRPGGRGRRLAAAVTDELALLAMPDARVDIRSAPRSHESEDPEHPRGRAPGRRPGARFPGADEVAFLLAANTGSEPRPLHKGASGGELSRVMLALEVVLAGTTRCPRSCSTRSTPGSAEPRRSRSAAGWPLLARTAQVLVVTHLPQVAAYADRHVLVEKASDGSVTSSGPDDARRRGTRAASSSRMLAGLADSDTALAHARELLEVARSRLVGLLGSSPEKDGAP